MGDTKKIIQIPRLPQLPKRKRVAAYARVSVEKDTMLHSLAAQVSHYSQLIQSNPTWLYAGVYADEGLTGTKENRPEFQRLLKDCREAKIDLVIVKSISRFARNTVTLLATVRELKALGIDVFFERENIHSMSGDGELMLSILASFAQEESLSVSENCKWRIRKEFSEGKCTFLRMYGYRVKDGQFTIVSEEAEVIRMIYSDYLSGMGTGSIAIKLNEMGIPAFGGEAWARSSVLEILRNEKVAGNLLLQKTFCADHLTKRKKRNHGELPQYFVSDAHDAIIDQETFDRVQEELKKRRELYDYGNSVIPAENRHPLSSKITCGLCGKHFIRKFGNSGAKYKVPIWICQTHLKARKEGCPSRRISEKVLFPLLASILLPEQYYSALGEDVRLLAEMNRIDEIIVYPDGRLIVKADGEEYTLHWENPSRAQSWTPEMKQRAKEKEMKRQQAMKESGEKNV